MKNKIFHESILNVIAILLLMLVIFNVSANFFYWSDGWTEILWYCDFAAIVLSIGILSKKAYLLSSVLISAIPAQFFWILDFILRLFGFAGFGRTAELFSWPFMSVFPSIIIHMALIPLSIYSIWVYGFDKRGFWGACIILAFTLPMAFAFSAYDDNVNCVFYPCDLTFDQAAYNSPHQTIDYFSVWYLLFVCIRWIFWMIIIYYTILFLIKRLFKGVNIL